MSTFEQERRTPRILIVEDEALLARQLDYTLRSLGYQVAGSFATGEEAIQMVQESQPDLILMDIRLQGDIDGIEAAEQIRQSYDIPVVFLTAYSETLVLERAQKAEPYGYLGKPVNETDLRSTIETVLHKHRADRQVRASEERYRSLYTKTPAMLHSIDADGKLVSVSDRWLEVMGYERDEVLGRRSTEFLTEESRRKAEEIILPKFYLEGFVKDASYQFVKKNGEVIDVLLSATAEFDSQGRFVRSLAVLENVTDRRRAEQALRESEENFRTFFATVDDLTLVGTHEGNILYTNPAVSRKLGYSHNELQEMRILDLHPPKLRQEAEDILARMFKGEQDVCPIPLESKHGELIPVETRVWFGKWSGRDCIFGVSKDLGKEQEALQKFDKLFHRNPALMAVNSLPERRFTEVNESFLKTLGFTREEVIGKTSGELGLFVDQAAQDLVAEELRKSGRISRIELRARRKDGEILHGLFTGEVIENQGKQSFLTVMVDVTDRKKAETACQEERDKAIRYLDAARVMTFALDREGNVTLANSKACEVLGRDEHEIVGANWFDNFLPKRDRDEVYGVFSQIMSGEVGAFEYYENPVVTSTGEERLIAWHNTFIRDDAGSVVSLLTSGEDITEKKQVAEELHKEKEKAERYLHTAGVIMVALDREGRVTLINRKGCEVLGYSAEEIVGRPWLDTYLPESDRERTKELFAQLMAGEVEHARYFENPVLTRNGEERLIAWYNELFTDEDGNIIGTLSSGEDVTDRRNAEEEIKRGREMLSLALEAANLGVWDWDVTSGKAIWSERMLDLLGYEPDELDADFKNWKNLVHPDDWASVAENLNLHLNGKSSVYNAEYRIRNKAGEWQWVHGRGKAVEHDPDGRPLRMTGIFGDISERKSTEEALRSSESEKHAILDSIQEVVTLQDRDGSLIWVNRVAAELIGMTPADLVGRKCYDIWHGRTERCLNCPVPKAFETGDVYAVQMENAEGRIWELRGYPVKSEEGTVSGVVEVGQDITDAKRAEQLALTSEKLKAVGELAGGVAHNFNNLLQIVLGCSQLALTDLELGHVTQAKDNLEQIVESSRFGAQTVKRLQDFARVRREDILGHAKVFDLANTVDEAIEMSKPWWKTKPEKDGVTIKLDRYVRRGCFVKGNENELFEVIVNLIKNAAEALDKGGEIRIRTSVDDDTAVLTVEDTGVGIPEQDRGKLFEPFWTTKGPQGTGMGLSSSYGIVQRHGGEIAVESESGEGTIFTVRLPLSAEQPASEERHVRRSVPFELNVLIVDDMPAVIKQLDGGLTSYGQTVYSASSGRVALKIFRETPINVVICDLAMPEMNGWEVGEEIRWISAERQIPKPIFILLTGWGGQLHEEDKILKSGIDTILEKPVDIGKLLEVIEELIKQRDAADE